MPKPHQTHRLERSSWWMPKAFYIYRAKYLYSMICSSFLWKCCIFMWKVSSLICFIFFGLKNILYIIVLCPSCFQHQRKGTFELFFEEKLAELIWYTTLYYIGSWSYTLTHPTIRKCIIGSIPCSWTKSVSSPGIIFPEALRPIRPIL